MYLVIKDPAEAKYSYLIEKRQQVGIKHGDINRYIEVFSDHNELNPDISIYSNSLVVFDDMICEADLNKNKHLPELFIRGRKMYINLIFITQSYFQVPKTIRINCTHYLMKISNRK